MDYWYNGEHKFTLYKTKNFSTPFMSTWMENTTGYQIEYPVKLIPTIRPMFVLPNRKENIIDIQGGNGLLDLSNALTGFPIYGNRQGDIGYVIAEYTVNDDWEDTLDFLNNAINNKFFYIVLDDDPDYFYYGRLQLTWEQSNNGSFNGVSIHYDLQPYKMSVIEYGRYTAASAYFDSSDLTSDGHGVVRPVPYGAIVPDGDPVLANDILSGPFSLEVALYSATDGYAVFENTERSISTVASRRHMIFPSALTRVTIPEFIVSNESKNNRCYLEVFTGSSSSTNRYFYIYFRRVRL